MYFPITIDRLLLVEAFFIVPYALKLMSTPGDTLAIGENNKGESWWPMLLSIILAWWMGSRPTDMLNMGYGDTINYVNFYLLFAEESEITSLDLNAEWLWTLIMYLCQKCDIDVNGWLLIIAFGYVLSAGWAMKKIVPTRPYLGFLFLVSSLTFYTFGVNGIRNGLACHLTLLAMAFFMEDRRGIAIAIAFLAAGIHRSVFLPMICIPIAWKVIKEPRHAIYIWLASIILSIFADGWFMNMFASIGFDDRMSIYLTGDSLEDNREPEFRWDFLAYSAVPVFLTYLINITWGRRDGWFNIIATTYILCNAFWILVIRAEFSNRFAYLSWFLYPVVCVYPLCNMKAWVNQDRTAGIILLAYYGFTFFMFTFFWH